VAAPAVLGAAPAGRLDVRREGPFIVVAGEEFSLRFDALAGRISQWRWGGHEMLVEGPRLNFWRAPIDNDAPFVAGWREKGLHRLMHRVDGVEVTPDGDTAVRIDVRTRIAGTVYQRAFLCTYHYRIDAGGAVSLAVEGQPQGDWGDTLPRVGLEMTLPGRYDRATWLGRGPGECYCDSLAAQRVGLYRRTVDELYTPYVMPQENGNRTDVRWVALTDVRGVGILAAGRESLNFSALHYTPADLTAAKHTCDLTPRDTVTLCLDHRQLGLGSAACGPGTLPQYTLRPEAFAFALRLLPVRADDPALPPLGRAAGAGFDW
jgi:beta-galactosidase/evolved beta-galactosidase subunit alpha